MASKKVWPSPPFRKKISGHALHAFLRQFRRPICPCTEIHHPHHSKSCICWFKFQLYRVVGLVVGCMMQVAAPSCIIAVASYVCLFVRLSVCMSGQSHATSMIQVLKKVTERKDIPLSLVCPYNYYYLIPLCKAGLNPCVNVLSKHYIHILWLWRLLLSI